MTATLIGIKGESGRGEGTRMESAADFRSKAAKCRALAGSARDEVTVRNLLALAEDYEEQALALEREAAPRPTPTPE